MLRIDPFGFADIGFILSEIVEPNISTLIDADFVAGTFVHNNITDFFAATHGDGFIDNRFQWNFFTASNLSIGCDHEGCADINNSLLQAFSRESTKDHRVDSPDTGACLHCSHTFNGHWHIDHDAIA